jgi:hypothetical protein
MFRTLSDILNNIVDTTISLFTNNEQEGGYKGLLMQEIINLSDEDDVLRQQAHISNNELIKYQDNMLDIYPKIDNEYAIKENVTLLPRNNSENDDEVMNIPIEIPQNIIHRYLHSFISVEDYEHVTLCGGALYHMLRPSHSDRIDGYVDYDLFIHGFENDDDYRNFVSGLVIRMVNNNRDIVQRVLYNDKSITILVFNPQLHNSYYQIQIIMRHYENMAEILHSFDVQTSCIGFDGHDIYFTKLGLLCMRAGVNYFDTRKNSKTYVERLFKYRLPILTPIFDKELFKNQYNTNGFSDTKLLYFNDTYLNVLNIEETNTYLSRLSSVTKYNEFEYDLGSIPKNIFIHELDFTNRSLSKLIFKRNFTSFLNHLHPIIETHIEDIPADFNNLNQLNTELNMDYQRTFNMYKTPQKNIKTMYDLMKDVFMIRPINTLNVYITAYYTYANTFKCISHTPETIARRNRSKYVLTMLEQRMDQTLPRKLDIYNISYPLQINNFPKVYNGRKFSAFYPINLSEEEIVNKDLWINNFKKLIIVDVDVEMLDDKRYEYEAIEGEPPLDEQLIARAIIHEEDQPLDEQFHQPIPSLNIEEFRERYNEDIYDIHLMANEQIGEQSVAVGHILQRNISTLIRNLMGERVVHTRDRQLIFMDLYRGIPTELLFKPYIHNLTLKLFKVLKIRDVSIDNTYVGSFVIPEDTKCIICFEKHPNVLLSCGHGVCYSCLLSMFKSAIETRSEELFVCPECRKLINVFIHFKKFKVIDNEGNEIDYEEENIIEEEPENSISIGEHEDM